MLFQSILKQLISIRQSSSRVLFSLLLFCVITVYSTYYTIKPKEKNVKKYMCICLLPLCQKREPPIKINNNYNVLTSTSFEGVGRFYNPAINRPFLRIIYRLCNAMLWKFPDLHGKAFRDKTTILLTYSRSTVSDELYQTL